MGIQINGQTDTISAVDGSITVATDLTVPGALTYDDVTNIDSVGIITARNGLQVTGGNVAIGHNNPSYMLHLKQYGNNEIVLNNTRGSSLGGFGLYDNHLEVNALSNHPLLLKTNSTERLRIQSDGKIGISDTSPENTLSIKNIGSFEGDANSFYLGSNFTGTGQNFSGSGKHAQRFFFNNASGNGYLRYENTGTTTGNAGDAITWQERFRIRADGTIRIGGDYYTDTSIQMSLKSISAGCQIQMHGTGTGTASSDGLRVGYNGAGGQMWLFESGYIRFATSNVEKLRITDDGKLGIKVTSPGCQTGGIHAVHDATQGTPSFTGAEVGIFQRNYNGAQDCAISIVSGTNASSTINFGDKDDVNPGIIEYMNGSNAMRFSTNAAERLRINSDGELSISGTKSGNNISDAIIKFNIVNSNGDSKKAEIKANKLNDISSDLIFSTTSSHTFAERFRISQHGRVGVNDDTGGYAEALQVTSHSSYNQYCLALKIQNNSGTFVRFANGTTAPCGSITSSGGNSTSYNQSSSDSRLKKNFETWDEEVLPHFKSLQPKKFNFTNEDDGTEKTKGFVAQDNVSNFPEAYPLADNPETNETRYMYNPSGMVIYLMKALQEEIAKREALEAKVAALEGS